MDCEEADKWMQARVEAWYDEVEATRADFDALASLEANEITNLAYEQRDLEEVAQALNDLAHQLWLKEHRPAWLALDRAARAVQEAADKIGAIDE